MRIEVTSQVTHRSNNDYACILVQFEDEDKHFFFDKRNWMPKTQEVWALHCLMLAIDPDYQELNKK